MIKKLDKKYLWMIIAFVSAVVLIGGVYLYSSSNIQPDHQKEFKQTSKPHLHLRKKPSICLANMSLVRVIRPRYKKMGNLGKLIIKQMMVLFQQRSQRISK